MRDSGWFYESRALRWSGGLNGGTKMCSCPHFWNPWILPYMAKDVIKLWVLREELNPGLSIQTLHALTCVLSWGTHVWHVSNSQREFDTDQRGENTEEKVSEDRGRNWNDTATSKGMLAATRDWKRQGMTSPLGPAEEVQLCHHFDSGLLASRMVENKCL